MSPQNAREIDAAHGLVPGTGFGSPASARATSGLVGRRPGGDNPAVGRVTQRLECNPYKVEVGGSSPSVPSDLPFDPVAAASVASITRSSLRSLFSRARVRKNGRMQLSFRRFLACGCVVIAGLLLTGGCGKHESKATTLTLDWKPEPEFGGFYQADLSGAFTKHGQEVHINSAGAGAPTWQLVANGQADFATTAADQVLIARASGADVVAVFAVYQTFPQGIMVHKARGFTRIEDVLTHPGTLAAEDATWLKYLLGKYQPLKVTVTGYGSGVSVFLAKPDYSQQCFVTSEPLLAAREGGDPQTFLIADAGYNPYTTVLITRGDLIRKEPQRVKAVVDACREGWRAYLDNPAPANAVMGKLNTEMDAQTFAQAAAAQKPLIETGSAKGPTLGTMSADRWNELAAQLVTLKVISSAPPAAQCFIDPSTLPGSP